MGTKRSFQDCKKLKKVVFPNHADLGILPNFALGCTALSKIEIDNWQYKMQDGVLYYYNTNSWAAQYYCEGYSHPLECGGILYGHQL